MGLAGQCWNGRVRETTSVTGGCAGAFDFDFEEQELDEGMVRAKVLEEVQHYAAAGGPWLKAGSR